MEEVLNNSQSATAQTGVHVEPELRRSGNEPNGVLRKDLKPMIYLGAATVVILAAVFSGVGKKSPATHAAANHEPPQPAVQDNTDNNVQTLKSNVAAARQRDQQLGSTLANSNNYPASASSVPAQQSASGYGPYGNSEPCLAGQPCAQGQSGSGGAGNGQSQLTPEQQEAQQIAAKERQRADESRFASNLVFARATEQPQQQPPAQLVPANYGASGQRTEESALVPPRAAGEQQETPGGYKRPLEANLDSATGPPYLVYEGSVLDTVLVNRLDGDAPGPVKVLVSNPLYSHDHQHVIIPEGTVVLGEVKKIGTSGFGQQRRMAVIFHRLIMPDGYSVDLDQFHGLDQIGEEGMKDKVNNHYVQIFGASIALGIVAGAGEITQGGGTITTSGSQAFTNGAASSVSQSASSILDRFMQIPPTITIREGHRVKVYFTQDMLLPAYSNHTIPQTF